MKKKKRSFRSYSEKERENEFMLHTQKGAPYLNTTLPVFDPIVGENTIRLLPVDTDDWKHVGIWGLKMNRYWFSNRYWISPTAADPNIEDYALKRYQELRNGNDEELIKLVKPSRRIMVMLLNQNKEADDGARERLLEIWPAPEQTIDSFVAASKHRRTGKLVSIEHHKRGRIIFFDRTGTGIGTSYSNVQIDNEDDPLEDSVLDAMPLFRDILVVPTPEEFKDAVDAAIDAHSSASTGVHVAGTGVADNDDDEDEEEYDREDDEEEEDDGEEDEDGEEDDDEEEDDDDDDENPSPRQVKKNLRRGVDRGVKKRRKRD